MRPGVICLSSCDALDEKECMLVDVSKDLSCYNYFASSNDVLSRMHGMHNMHF
jgi:hypothetical protein